MKRVAHVIGLDLSVRLPGAVALPVDWHPGDWARAKSWRLPTVAPKTKEDLEGRYRRYLIIVEWVKALIEETTAVRGAPGRRLAGLYIEQYAFKRNNAQASALMELGGAVRVELFKAMGIVAETVSTAPARKLFLGKLTKVGRGQQKLLVQDRLFKRCKAPKSWDENQADAFVVANYGLGEVGSTVLTLQSR